MWEESAQIIVVFMEIAGYVHIFYNFVRTLTAEYCQYGMIAAKLIFKGSANVLLTFKVEAKMRTTKTYTKQIFLQHKRMQCSMVILFLKSIYEESLAKIHASAQDTVIAGHVASHCESIRDRSNKKIWYNLEA